MIISKQIDSFSHRRIFVLFLDALANTHLPFLSYNGLFVLYTALPVNIGKYLLLDQPTFPAAQNIVGIPVFYPVLCSIARDRAAVARRAHNPKVIGSIPVLATLHKTLAQQGFCFEIFVSLSYISSSLPIYGSVTVIVSMSFTPGCIRLRINSNIGIISALCFCKNVSATSRASGDKWPLS